MQRARRSIAFLILAFTTSVPTVWADESKQPFFETDVHPILRAHCFHCHGETDEVEGGLDLRLRRFIVTGGDSGTALQPGDPEASLLLERIVSGEMPPEDVSKRPTKEEVATIRRWIESGAATKRDEPKSLSRNDWITDEDRAFWSFQPVRRPVPPKVTTTRIRTAIDQFILAKLETHELSFSQDASRATLIRRAYFDLLGLPPTPDQVQEFVEDPSDDAYEQLIDRLLASPQYGERWGRHWLDVAGYADSEGVNEADVARPHAWRYRDFVIQAFNENLPVDQFILWQLAGDELVENRDKFANDDVRRLTATGFLRMAPDGTASSNKPEFRNEMASDTIEIVASSLLGMTVACAECHNHRYDPISQQDYYRLRAVFDPSIDINKWRTPKQRLVSLYTDEDREEAKRLEVEAKKVEAERTKKQNEYIEATFEKELAKLPEEIRDAVREARGTTAKKRTAEQKKLLRDHPSVNVTAGSLYLYDKKAADELKKMAANAKAIREKKPRENFLRSLNEGQIATPPKSFVFVRGDHEQRGAEVAPQGLQVLGGASIPINDPTLPSTGRRLAYARWLTSSSHPLTARVIANRIWMHHFGQGIVNTPADFGRLGTPPSHPQLLDWLASELVDGGWDLKAMHRLIMTSTVYRQASVRRAELEAIDSQNRLLGRMSIRRLDAESLRDSVLKISGRLLSKRFGEPVPVMADRVGQWVIGKENLNAGRPGPVLPMHGEDLRRSIYVQVRRSRPLAVLDTFDLPSMAPNCDQRSSSTVATQSLMLMNGGFLVSQATAIAERAIGETNRDENESPEKLVQRRVDRVWRLIYSRAADNEELAGMAEFVSRQAAEYRKSPPEGSDAKKYGDGEANRDALALLCHALLSSNEFLYVD